MNLSLTRLATLSGLGLAALLSACATAQPEPAATTAAAEQPKKQRQYVTGSRLPASDSTQIVRGISGGSAHESLRSQPNPGRPGQ